MQDNCSNRRADSGQSLSHGKREGLLRMTHSGVFDVQTEKMRSMKSALENLRATSMHDCRALYLPNLDFPLEMLPRLPVLQRAL